MVNNNLQHINLGAPTSIEITENQYPNAELTVQSMERCDTLSLHDNGDICCIGDTDSVEAAFRLVGNLARQRALKTDDDSRHITFNALSMSASCRDGGIVQLSAEGLDDVFWVIDGNVVSGWYITINGVLTIPSGCHDVVTIKAVSKTNINRRSMFKLDVESFGAIYNELTTYPNLCDILVEWSELAPFISKQRGMGKVISDYPNIVHSLLDTGKKNYVNFDGSSFIHTSVIPNKDTRTECTVRMTTLVGSPYNTIFGSASKFYYHFGCLNGNSIAFGSGYGNSYDGRIIRNEWVKLKYDIEHIYLGDAYYYIKSSSSLTSSIPVSTVDIAIGKTNTSNNGQWSGTFVFDLEELSFYEAETAIRRYVPYKKEGVVGLMDLVNLMFYPKDQGTGTLTIIEAEERDN